MATAKRIISNISNQKLKNSTISAINFLHEQTKYLEENQIYCGDSKGLLKKIKPNSIALSIWSPPYHVGKSYEQEQTYEEWLELLEIVIFNHFNILKPGGFLAINIGDILCFKDSEMPKIQANNVSMRKCSVTEEDVKKAQEVNPNFNRRQLAKLLNCSEQTIHRRQFGNNIRGGKYETQTRVKIVGGLIEGFALNAGLYLYDRRIWSKDPSWANSHWTTNSYRAVDEFEYLYIFWKPGETIIDRNRLTKEEWTQWGSRGIWQIRSVQNNNNHESKFPVELPLRAIKLFTNKDDIILDCFIGSGATALAALQAERNFIGIDIRTESVDLANKQIEEYKSMFYKL